MPYPDRFFEVLLEGVDKIEDIVMACYLGCGGACHGNETAIRFSAAGESRWQTVSIET
jgi:hypothetical protein